MQHSVTFMKATKINGIEYFTVPEILKELRIVRQTLWRWRQQGKIPAGHRYRDRNLLYTSDEVEEIRQFANRVEDIGLANKNQLTLFNLK
jgi:predicted site-specific integrase-resolvase